MKPFALTALLSFVVLLAPELSAQAPQISPGGVLNAASYAQPGVLAPGVIFSVFGTSLTDGSTAAATTTPLPDRLAGARLLVNGVPAPLFFASPRQLNAQFPVDLAGLTSALMQVEVETTAGTLTSPTVAVSVVPASPGIFTLNQNGSGPGEILRISDRSRICPPGRSDCSANPAIRGEIVSIYMSGLGQVNDSWVSGEAAQRASPTVLTPLVTIGGMRAQVLFSALVSGFVGLYQVHVAVPGNSPTGDSAPLDVTIGGRAANQVTISIGTAPPVSTQGGGPPGGGINAIAIDPRNPLTLYASTGAAVYKTINGGQWWTAINTGLAGLGIRALVVDPINSATVYAVIYRRAIGGVFKSANAGASWAPADSGLPGTFVNVLAIDPANPATLHAGTAGGVFKSTDAGASWIAANTGLPTTNTNVSALAVDPVHTATIYAATGGSIFKSSDSGANWTAANGGLPPNIYIPLLAIDPVRPATLYAATSGRVFKSTDGGGNWTIDDGSLLNTGIYSLAIDPVDPATLYAGTYNTGVFKSRDGGTTWVAANGGLPNRIVLALAIDPAGPATLYAGTGSGVFKTSDAGARWNPANSGITATNVGALSVDRANPATVYAGTSSGVFKSTDAGARWSAADRGLAGSVRVLVIDSSNPAILYAGIGGANILDGVYKSVDGGASWTGIWNGAAHGVRTLAMDPSNPSVLYVAAGNTPIFKSTDGGASWTALNIEAGDFFSTPFGANTFFCALVIDPVNPATVYAGACGGISRGGVLKSTDGGANWTTVNNGLRTPDNTFFVTGLAIDPTNPATIYASGAGVLGASLFKSTDGGESWTAANNGLPNRANTLAIDPVNPATIYAGTFGAGVFKSTDGGVTWQPTGAE